jgi:ribonucleoside-diphosphate reductase alpha chain
MEWTSETRIGVVKERASVLDVLINKFGDKKENWPTYVVTAQTLTPEEHVNTQACVQQFIDASISKTINMPEEATVEDVSKAYRLLWEKGCKGGTVYRSGSMDEQVLYTEEMSEEGIVEVIQEPMLGVIRPRLNYGIGAIFSEEGPTGTIHVAIRHDVRSGDPEDVFVTCGKGDVDADAQAIGRLSSMFLRSNIQGASQQTKLDMIRDQLEDINGRMQYGIGPDAKVSLPDTVAKVLRKYLSGEFQYPKLPFGSQQLIDMLNHVPGEFTKENVLAYLLGNIDEDLETTMTHQEDERTQENTIKRKYDICANCGNTAFVKIPGKCGYCEMCGESAC